MGRLKGVSTSDAQVAGAPTTLQTATLHDLAARKIIEISPFEVDASQAPQTTTELDRLGRPVRITESAFGSSSTLVQRMAYDLHGQVSYVTDTVRSAEIYERDGLGRATGATGADGLSSSTSYTPWGEPQVTIAFDANGNAVAQTNRIFTSKGRLRTVKQKMDPPLSGVSDDLVRQTRFDWRDGEKFQGVRVGVAGSMTSHGPMPDSPVRISETENESNGTGRLRAQRFGEGSGLDGPPTKVFSENVIQFYDGDQPAKVVTREPIVGAEFPRTMEYDDLGRLTRLTEAGAFETRYRYDEEGNLLALTAPGMNEATAAYDSRGLPVLRTHPDGEAIALQYNALGNQTQYADESGQITKYDMDPLGRVAKVRYPDGTFEQFAYEDITGALLARRDRDGTWMSYRYDLGGRLTEIRDTEDLATGTLLVRYTYDPAGRLTLVANADAAVSFSEFDFLGRPRATRAIRYADATGLDAAPVIRDIYTQNHRWNEHDEIVRWSLPVAGEIAPGGDLGNGWRTWIDQEYDGAGNLIRQQNAFADAGPATGEVIATGFARGPGRLMSRTRLPSSAGIGTTYSYADGSLPAPPSIETPPPPD
ncbi:MAG: hypothetical protein ACSLFQ_22055, partial [Thermoanaerobaculia bacterium]